MNLKESNGITPLAVLDLYSISLGYLLVEGALYIMNLKLRRVQISEFEIVDPFSVVISR